MAIIFLSFCSLISSISVKLSILILEYSGSNLISLRRVDAVVCLSDRKTSGLRTVKTGHKHFVTLSYEVLVTVTATVLRFDFQPHRSRF